MIKKKITSWSMSRYLDYRQCPAKAKYKHIDKLFEPKNDAMVRGNLIHKIAEDYIKGKIIRVPPELKAFEAEFKKLKAQYKKKENGMVVEDNWAFTATWGETEWNNWALCWLRVKLDCAHHEDEITLIVSDWKTGKFREESNADYIEQLELYALAALLLYAHIEVVKPRLVYLDLGIIYPGEGDEIIFTRKDIARLKKLWIKRTKAMLNDTTFAPRPNDKCRWCHFSKSKAGPCKF